MAALVGSTSSCSAPDPGQVTFIERPKGQTGDLTSGGTSGLPADGGSSGDAGGEAGVDGGSSGLPVTAFTGAPAGLKRSQARLPMDERICLNLSGCFFIKSAKNCSPMWAAM